MADPVTDFLTRFRGGPAVGVVDDPPEEPISSVEDLRGTVFDNSDPFKQFQRQSAPKPPKTAVQRAIGSTMDFLRKPVAAIADPLERNADYLTNSIPESETPLTGYSPLSYMKAFGAGVNKTIAGMASPAGMASFSPDPIVGPSARAFLASQQIPEGVEKFQRGDRLAGAADVALGGALVAGDVGRGINALKPAPATIDPPLSAGFWESYDRANRPKPPAPERLGLPPAGSSDNVAELTRLFLEDGGGPGAAPRALNPKPGAPPPSSPIDVTPPLLGTGQPPGFVAGDAGVTDVRDNGPIEPAPPAPRGAVAQLPARAGDAVIGMPEQPRPSPADIYAGRDLKPGDPLAELEAQLYPQSPAEAGPSQQNFPVADAFTQERPNVVQAAATPAPEGNLARGPEAPAGNRTLAPGTEGSIDELDALEQALGRTDRLPGNGGMPAGPAAGEVAPGGGAEQPGAPASGLDAIGSGGRSPEGGRPARTPADDAFDELIGDAQKNGYQGDPEALRNELADLLKMDDEINGEFNASGKNPENLLRAIQKNGGLADGPREGGPNLLGTSLEGDPWAGEIARLKEFGDGPFGSVNGIQKIFRRPGKAIQGTRDAGKTLAQMLEALREDPNFSHIETPDDLLRELQLAAGAEKPGKDAFAALERMGVKYGEPWWKVAEGGDSFNPADFAPADKAAWEGNEFGEEQGRLPGDVGDVRDAQNKTPEFEAPFSLNAEADRGPRELEQALSFDEPKGKSEAENVPSTKLALRIGNGTEVRAVDSLEEAQQLVRRLVDEHELTTGEGASTFPSTTVIDPSTGDMIARVHYNGRLERLDRALPESSSEIPGNVRSFLTRQLGYTPEEVAALGPAEARRIGEDQVAHPEREQRRAPKAPEPIDTLPEREQLPSMENFDELRGARGQQRRAELERTAVHPEEPGAGDNRQMVKSPADRSAAGEQLTVKERQALNLPEEPRERGVRSLRDQGASPRQVARRVERMDAWIGDPTPENFARWVQEVSGQAERVNERQLKGGTGEEKNMPGKSSSGETLAASLFGVPLDADTLKRLGRFMVSNDSVDRLIRGAIGGAAGAMSDDEHRLRGAFYGFLTGMMAPEVARAVSNDMVMLIKGEVPKGLPAVYNARPEGDIGIVENLFGSRAHTVPEQLKNVRGAVDELQSIRDTGKMDTRSPLLQNLDRGAAIGTKDGKLQIDRKGFLKPEIKYLRDEATKAGTKGKPRMASYLTAYADELAGVMTRSEKMLSDMGVKQSTSRRVSSEVANQVSRNGLAFNAGSAVVNRASQPLLTAPYVGLRNLWKNYAPLSEAEKGMSTIHRPVEMTETAKAANSVLQKFDEVASSMMRFTDNQNRQGAYAAAHLAAEQAGANPQQAALFARDVAEKTQGLLGMNSGNPRWRGPLITTIKPFTKYPILFAEWMNDVATSADPRVRWRTAAMGAGVFALSKATGVDMWDLLAGGARYGGAAMLRAAMDIYAHATNQAKDHKIAAMPGSGFKDSDLGTMAYPVGIRKGVETAGRFLNSGLDTHVTRTPSGAKEEISPVEDVLNLLGAKTTRQTDRQNMLDEAHAHETAAAEADSQDSAQAKRDLLRALDSGDDAGAQDALSKMPPNTRKSVLKSQNRDRFERLLHATPKKRRPELLDNYGELEKELGGR